MRCNWADHSEAERRWHDEVWGIPQYAGRPLFEMLTLKGAQAGLAWRTVLQKREGYRRVFLDYDVDAIAAMSDHDIDTALRDRHIVRHRLKVASVRTNARAVVAMGGVDAFAALLWSFVDGRPRVNAHARIDDVPMRSDISDCMSAELRCRGFAFAGTAICYSVMQAAGLVNDHLVTCDRYR